MTEAELVIQELQDPDGDLARQALAICEQSFPEVEREPTEQFRTMLRQRLTAPPPPDRANHFWVAHQTGSVVGLATFSYYAKPGLTFIGYMAIRPDLKGRGYGSILFQKIINQPPVDAARFGGRPWGACFEVQRPEDVANETDRLARERRIRFYQRHGAQLIDRVEFVAPPLAPGFPPVPFYLMFRPATPGPLILTQSQRRQIVESILIYDYGLAPDDPYLHQNLSQF
jgi:GNAT superfamily N-acetyltransferase